MRQQTAVRTAAATLFTATAVLALGSAANADTIILEQGFENTTAFPADTALTTSTSDTSGRDGDTEWWHSNGLAASQPTPRSNTGATIYPVRTGAQSLEITRNDPNNANLLARSDTVSASAGTLSFEFYFKREASGSFTAKIADTSALATSVPTVFVIGDNRFAIHNGVDRNPNDANPTDPGWQTLDINGAAGGNGALDATTWYGARMIIDLAAKTYDTYLDQGAVFVQVGSATPYTDNVGDIDGLVFGPAGGQAYLDDVRLAVIPEPATVGLVAAGAALMLHRRAGR